MAISTSSHLEHFEKRGYAVLRGLLDPESNFRALHSEYGTLLAALASQWHAEGKLSSAYAGFDLGARFAAVFSEMDPSCMQYFDISLPKFRVTEETPIHLGPAVFNLMRNPRLLDAVETFMGPEVYSNPIQRVRIRPPQKLFLREHFNPFALATPWHQDLSVYLPEADDSNILSVWIPITEATPDNGCLLVIPGSHKGGLLPHATASPGGAIKMGAHITDSLIDSRQATAIPMSPGDVLFFHKKTIHAATPNRSDGTRWSIDFRYNPIGQPTGRPTFPGFVARSRRHPEQELTDPEAWAQLWRDCRRRLAASGEVMLTRF